METPFEEKVSEKLDYHKLLNTTEETPQHSQITARNILIVLSNTHSYSRHNTLH